jgi:hypothetical protein
MNVSIQLTKTAHSPDAGKRTVLRDVDLDTALAISAALRELHQADLEAVIVVENLPTAKRPVRAAAKPQHAGFLSGWLRGLRPAMAPVPAR